MENFPNFTPSCQKIVSDSKLLAEAWNHEEVNCGHLLVAIMSSSLTFVNDLIVGFNVPIDSFIKYVEDFYGLEPSIRQSKKTSYGEDVKTLLSNAHEFAIELGNDYISAEHLFFIYLNDSNGPCYHFLKSQKVSPSKVMEAFLIIFKSQQIFHRNESGLVQPIEEETVSAPGQPGNDPNSMLDSFCVNLHDLNSKGSLPKVIGKDFEMDRMCEILGRKIKNNPLLVGDPGVGKTAIVEGLVQRIDEERVPPFLSGKKIYSVDLASMIAGTKYRGQFEKRLKFLLKECSELGNIILFIDEAHTIVGAGNAEGTMDASNILKPALARGDLTVIGATTFPEYKKNIEKDVALSRRFENITVEEPSTIECYKILKGIKFSYEKFHGVSYDNDILKKIVSLCDEYLPQRKFPDKAIDVMDEVGSKLKIKNSMPTKEMLTTENKIYNLSPQAIGTKREEDLLDKYISLSDSWEKSSRRKVAESDVIDCISVKAKLPKENFHQGKDDKSLSLGRKLNRDVINQKDAISNIHKSILRFKLGLKDLSKPIGSFLCLGASGVGKTWTAKMLAKHYFGSEKNIIRFDMSEYSDKVSSAKLTGASPGYIGYEEGGILIEAIKKKPHCVLLFDEIEKSHPQVQQLLLQILEEGELQDNIGTTVYFKDTIIILTSNIGADITTKSSLGFSPNPESNDSKIYEVAKKILSPELVNRLDSVIIFKHLGQKDLFKIFKSEVRKLSSRLKKKNVLINISDDAAHFLCEKASVEKMGARPLKRLIKSEIEDIVVEHYFKKKEDKQVNFNFCLNKDSISHSIY